MAWAEDVYDGIDWFLFGCIQIFLIIVVLRTWERLAPAERQEHFANASRADVLYTLFHRLGIFHGLVFIALSGFFFGVDSILINLRTGRFADFLDDGNEAVLAHGERLLQISAIDRNALANSAIGVAEMQKACGGLLLFRVVDDDVVVLSSFDGHMAFDLIGNAISVRSFQKDRVPDSVEHADHSAACVNEGNLIQGLNFDVGIDG